MGLPIRARNLYTWQTVCSGVIMLFRVLWLHCSAWFRLETKGPSLLLLLVFLVHKYAIDARICMQFYLALMHTSHYFSIIQCTYSLSSNAI